MFQQTEVKMRFYCVLVAHVHNGKIFMEGFKVERCQLCWLSAERWKRSI